MPDHYMITVRVERIIRDPGEVDRYGKTVKAPDSRTVELCSVRIIRESAREARESALGAVALALPDPWQGQDAERV